MTYELIEKETIGILAGKGSGIAKRLASGTPVTLNDARGDSFVYLTQGHSVRVVQDKLFRRYGFNPHMLLQTDSLEVGRRIVLEAGACMLMSNIYVDDYVRQKGGEFFPLADYENNRHFYQELLRINHLKKYFQTPRGTLSAVDDVTFSINERETLGVVGESGCGKSTLPRIYLCT